MDVYSKYFKMDFFLIGKLGFVNVEIRIFFLKEIVEMLNSFRCKFFIIVVYK